MVYLGHPVITDVRSWPIIPVMEPMITVTYTHSCTRIQPMHAPPHTHLRSSKRSWPFSGSCCCYGFCYGCCMHCDFICTDISIRHLCVRADKNVRVCTCVSLSACVFMRALLLLQAQTGRVRHSCGHWRNQNSTCSDSTCCLSRI
jgi:hypothetical protein